MKHFKLYILFVLLAFTITVRSQVITTVAGNGTVGYSGDGGLATSAQIYFPVGVYVDASNNIFIAGQDNRIRKVNASTGIITTIAGNGTAGFSGDGGLATSASINQPYGIYEDAAGNIYIASTSDYRIRKVNTSGIISTIAGTGTQGYTGDGGAATSAEIYYVQGITGDASGNIYFADFGYGVIRKINSLGIISTIAGTGTQGYSGDGGLATSALLGAPNSISFDAAGNYYIGDDYNNNDVRKVNTSNIISTIAGGSATRGTFGDGGPATAALFCDIESAITDSSGNIYIADACNNKIRKVNAVTGIITTIVGTGVAGYSSDGGLTTNAKINSPWSVSLSNGNLYIADSKNNRIRKVTLNGTLIANREFTDAQGWTQYYYDNGTPTDFSDDTLLLSLQKNGNNIGTVGDGTFQLKLAATSGEGTNTAVNVGSALVRSGTQFYSMNRYWDVTPTTQPTSPVGVRFYYNTQDLADING